MKKIITVCLLFTLSIYGKTQPGTPDSTFGTNGKVLSETYDGICNSSAIQNDGKIVLGGSGGFDGNYGFLVVRYNSNGSIDQSFGNNGRALNDLSDPDVPKTVYRIAIQPDGKIIAAGTYNSALALVRYNADGSIDTGFGDNGLAVYDLSTRLFHIMRDMALLPDGRIIMVGDIQSNQNDNRRSFVCCYTAAGILDESFGNTGEVIINTSENADINAVAITKDNKILVAGNYTIYRKTILFKYNTDGTADINFGETGFSYMNFDSDITSQAITDIAVNQENLIITTGTAFTNSNNSYSSLITSKFLPTGAPDSSYGKDGYSIISIPNTVIQGRALSLGSIGNLFITGGMSGMYNGPIVMSLKQNGIIDSTFGIDGIAEETFLENGSDMLNSITVQEDGKIIVAGYSLVQTFPDYRYYFIIGRFNGYGIEKNKYVKIKKWLHRHGFTWEDLPGRNISYYSVQRSGSGNNFTEIARLFNRNNQQQFRYSDAAPLTGDNYYRLAAVTADDAVVYSNILSIPNNEVSIKIYPNPAKNNLVVEGLPTNTKAKLFITDLNGVARLTTVANNNTYNWNISNLKQGNYVLQVVVNGNSIATKKFIKE